MHLRKHGTTGPLVIALHGGPAAAGTAAPLARGLAGRFRVLEPWQRESGDEPLTVARHVADLHELVTGLSEDTSPALVGWSWGAMLALAYAAGHPGSAGPVVLVGCGTFDTVARERMREILEERTTDEMRRSITALETEWTDPGERQVRKYELTQSLYLADPLEAIDIDEVETFDLRAHQETWNDMLRLQEEGVYPAAFAAITSPVLMLHGAYDPHPGGMIRDGLLPWIPHLEYHEWERCGHNPWMERGVRDDFFARMEHWLLRHAGESPPAGGRS
jgi:pimeloyl-ACP methyl ester carboxylesterase